MTRFLKGKAVKLTYRHQPSEVVIEFTDGARVFVNATPEGRIEISLGERRDETA